MNKVFAVTTKKYSVFFKHLFDNLDNFSDICIYVNNEKVCDYKSFANSWLRNKVIKDTHDFKIIKDGEVLCQFHDDPSDIFLSKSQEEFLKKMAAIKVIRYEEVEIKKGFLLRVFECVQRKLSAKQLR